MPVARANRLRGQSRVKLDGEMCVYCGMRPDHWDHFPPATVSRSGFLIPACRECNCIAGTSHPFDFTARCELVKDKLRKRNRKWLRFPLWSQDDKEEMSDGFQREIDGWQAERRIAHARIAWNAEEYLLLIARHKGFAANDADSLFTIRSGFEFSESIDDD